MLEDDALNSAFLVNFQKKIVDTVMEKKKKRETKKEEMDDGNPSDKGNPDDW